MIYKKKLEKKQYSHTLDTSEQKSVWERKSTSFCIFPYGCILYNYDPNEYNEKDQSECAVLVRSGETRHFFGRMQKNAFRGHI